MKTNNLKVLFFTIVLCFVQSYTFKLFSQGASVSPSRIYFNVTPGNMATKELKITSSSTKKELFKVEFEDFEPQGIVGKSTLMAAGESANSMVKWLSASPDLVELMPGESQNVQISLNLPNIPEANAVKWSVISIKLSRERTAPIDKGPDVMGMGIMETFQFVVHVFQTPPTVTEMKAELVSFKATPSTINPTSLALQVRNTGPSILDCASYLEFTNTSTGTNKRSDIKAFTLLPNTERLVNFPVNDSILAKGKYSVLGIADYGSKEEVVAGELDIEMK